jgi:hypothetical protein
MEIKRADRLHPLPRIEEYPDIDLYMDQVITFMEKKYPRRPLTKTMINNYTKDRILPPPIRKKYSREHLMLLSLLQVLKGTQSLPEVKKVLYPISQELAKGDSTPLYKQYRSFLSMQDELDRIVSGAMDEMSLLSADKGIRAFIASAMATYFSDLTSEIIGEMD